MTFGLLLTALTLGIRHGVDWDHIAAIADLSSASGSRRRGITLSFLYAGGHALIVLVLGVLAIAFGTRLPESADAWMGRVVGLTLVVLGAWILIDLVRSGRDFRLRSRWILVLGGTFAGLRRIRNATSRRRVGVTHEHQHEHDQLVDHRLPPAHDHAHLTEAARHGVDNETMVAIGVGAPADRRGRTGGNRESDTADDAVHHHQHHHHRHRHELALVGRTSSVTGNGTAAGIGILHGIGFESPTQIAVFVASTSVVGASAGLVLLGAWIAGLLISNSLLAGLAAFGLLGAERNFTIYATIAVVVGAASLVMGALLIRGFDGLPDLVL